MGILAAQQLFATVGLDELPSVYRLFAALLLAACATVESRPASTSVTVGILAINDFHGALGPPRPSFDAFTPAGERLRPVVTRCAN